MRTRSLLLSLLMVSATASSGGNFPTACDQRPHGPPRCQDSDGDGLCDSWELAKHTPGGVPLPDADPNRPDIYLHYDWMDYGPMETPCNNTSDCRSPYAGLGTATCSGPALTQGFAGSCVLSCNLDSDCTSLGPTHATDRCGTAHGVNQCLHTHDPALLAPNGKGGSAAIDAVVAAFADHGYNLHIVRGYAYPHSHVVSFHTLDDPGNLITDACEGGSVTSGNAGIGKYAESIYDLKTRGFDQRMNLAYHYALFGHYTSCDSPAHCAACPVAMNTDGTVKNTSIVKFQSSGVSEFFGNDFIVSLANFINEKGNPPDIYNIGGTFMHELGHNLGLHHGGGFDADGTGEDTEEFKPNYLSVMNYNYQFVGIPVLNGPPLLNYSEQVLPTGGNTPGMLDESNLDEFAGLGSGNPNLLFFTYDGSCNFRILSSDGPVDWDGDGAIANSHAVADLDPYDHSCGAITSRRFRGHVDWPRHWTGPSSVKFTFQFQCTSLAEDPLPPD